MVNISHGLGASQSKKVEGLLLEIKGILQGEEFVCWAVIIHHLIEDAFSKMIMRDGPINSQQVTNLSTIVNLMEKVIEKEVNPNE